MSVAKDISEIMCLKLTGELIFVLKIEENGTVKVDRPVMTRDGIRHQTETFTLSELETSEEHLRREASEMLLKAKIQKEVLRAEEKEEAEEAPKAVPNLRVN